MNTGTTFSLESDSHPALRSVEMTRSKSLRCIVLCLLALLLGPLAQAESESAIKAANLFKFAQVMDWPEAAFSGPKAPLVIGIIERDPVGDELKNYAGEIAKARRVEVRRVSAGDIAELRACHIIFVPGSGRVEGVVEAVAGHPVLIVGESENFVLRGGAIGFVMEKSLVKFEVNPTAASKGGLTINSRLIKLARGVVK
jgi:hypothetical protein